MINVNSKSERRLKIAVVIAFSAYLIFLSIAYRKIQQDDAYIIYKYAENISSANGYVFNEGERVNATTSTLYTLTLASLYSLMRWLPWITLPIIGHLIGAVSLWVAAFFSMKMFKDAGLPTVASIFPLVFLANPLLKNAVGMETFLTLALIILSLYLYQKERVFLLSAVCGLAVLSRPDSVILPFILIADYVVRKRSLPPLTCFSIFAIVLIPWILFNYLYFHSPLPCTLSVKLGQTQSGRWGTGFIFLQGLFNTAWPYAEFTKWPIGITLAISAFYIIFIDRGWAHERIAVLIFVWGIIYLIVYGIVLNPPAYPWYYTPLCIPMTLMLALVPEMITRRLVRRGSANYCIILLLMAILGIGIIIPVKSLNDPVTAKYENYKLAANWLNAYAFDGATVGASEIGVLGYFYKRGKIIDALGLVTPEVADHVKQGDYSWYIHKYQPHFLMFNYPNRKILEAMVHEQWFQQYYKRVVVIPTKRRAVAIYRRQLKHPPSIGSPK